MFRRSHARAGLALMLLIALTTGAAAATGKVNVNTAKVEQLTLLPRVGPVVAQRIIEFRDKNGRFKAPEDLLLVSGIGDRTFELIKPYVALEGETTLKEKVATSREEGE